MIHKLLPVKRRQLSKIFGVFLKNPFQNYEICLAYSFMYHFLQINMLTYFFFEFVNIILLALNSPKHQMDKLFTKQSKVVHDIKPFATGKTPVCG